MKNQLTNTLVLLEHLKKELNGKPEFSGQTSSELDALIEEIKKAHLHEISQARYRALVDKSLTVLGAIVRLVPEIIEIIRHLS